MTRILCLQHADEEGPGALASWARDRGHELSVARMDCGEAAPPVDAFDWLVVLGGAMGVDETARHPWLRDEKRLVGASLDAGRTTVGICLGAQVLADVLGAAVRRNGETEIGWHPVRRTEEGAGVDLFRGFPDAAEVFHWHGDTFDVPAGATRVLASDACANQAFVLGRNVVGVQFHPEMTAETAAALVRTDAADLVDAPYVQRPAQILRDGGRFARMHALLHDLLDRLARAG